MLIFRRIACPVFKIWEQSGKLGDTIEITIPKTISFAEKAMVMITVEGSGEARNEAGVVVFDAQAGTTSIDRARDEVAGKYELTVTSNRLLNYCITREDKGKAVGSVIRKAFGELGIVPVGHTAFFATGKISISGVERSGPFIVRAVNSSVVYVVNEAALGALLTE